MEFQQNPRLGAVVVSFIVASLANLLPLPSDWLWFRPEFVVLVVIYWTIALPEQVGVGAAFIMGLIQDVLENALLGQHALAFVVLAYVCSLSYRRIRNFAVWQQSVWVFVLVGIHQLMWNWGSTFSGRTADSLIFLLPALTSALVWPLVMTFTGLRRLRPSR